jgi:hypothetical protein
MTFGQQAGPPASPGQVRELLNLLAEAGHSDFRDARGPMGLTQRQAGGRFTRNEAAALIEQLQGTSHDESTTVAVPSAQMSAQEQLLRRLPAEQLAAELLRRGWTVLDPARRA